MMALVSGVGFTNRSMRLAPLFGAFLLLTFAATASYGGEGSQPAGLDSAEQPNFFIALFLNLFNSRALLNLLSQPEFELAAFLALNIIVFTETGLLIGFFL